MTGAQKMEALRLYRDSSFERGGITRAFREVLESAIAERPPSRNRPFVLITDEKLEYQQVLFRLNAFREQDLEHRVAHVRISSKLPRTRQNPLFASNYLDAEIRKDQANHHRETRCYSRNASNGMARLACYLIHHNYRKRFLVKAPVGDSRVHAELAGIDREVIERSLRAMFARRAFLSRIRLPITLERIWRKSYPTPRKAAPDRVPAFALA